MYLSPRDYHRIHMPLDGQLYEMMQIPGRVFSVNAATTRTVPRLFARNERVVCMFETAAGPMALVMVGALFVGSMDTVWARGLCPPYPSWARYWRYGNDEVELARGQEMGRFNMGSTVVLLFPPGRMTWTESLAASQPVRMGQTIGLLRENN